ncbi:MAG: cyclopropane fatty acyl phospholipid synthase [Candidatus Staskawiczbacteria bacterium]|nr:cyclopropane fatty acyl phospholipid synthase [Candidatus Staskawiczbacteria bacterium]
MNTPKQQVEKLLQKAGITINGKNNFDPQVHNEELFQRVLTGGSLALGEAYVDGWWDAKNIDEFFYKILSEQLQNNFNFSWPVLLTYVKFKVFNLSSPSKSFEVGEKHYDIGNNVYEAMLGETLAYTCGYWKDAKTLDEAQYAKLDLVCKKIGLKKGDTILDIGCGWGSFLKFAAERYGAMGVGVTVSKEQVKLGNKLCKGLPVEIRLQDYRDLTGKFDHVVSLGMFEHVGAKNYRTYFKKVSELLKDDGLFLLHTIGWNNRGTSVNPWIEKYIFPNGMLPSIGQIGKATERLMVIEDWHNFGADYDKTLMAWFENFDKAWPKLKSKYSQKFYRVWKYYLLTCAAGFRVRNTQLWQIVLSKRGMRGGYRSIR